MIKLVAAEAQRSPSNIPLRTSKTLSPSGLFYLPNFYYICHDFEALPL